MPRKIQAISPLVDRLMLLIEGSPCVSGKEFDVELALREALGNAVVHGNQEDPEANSARPLPLRARRRSIHRRDGSRKGFDFAKALGCDLAWELAAVHGHGIQMMKAYMDDVHFERGGSEAHMRKCSRPTLRS
jgi:serine/threonine-protein kinase RsbW